MIIQWSSNGCSSTAVNCKLSYKLVPKPKSGPIGLLILVWGSSPLYLALTPNRNSKVDWVKGYKSTGRVNCQQYRLFAILFTGSNQLGLSFCGLWNFPSLGSEFHVLLSVFGGIDVRYGKNEEFWWRCESTDAGEASTPWKTVDGG